MSATRRVTERMCSSFLAIKAKASAKIGLHSVFLDLLSSQHPPNPSLASLTLITRMFTKTSTIASILSIFALNTVGSSAAAVTRACSTVSGYVAWPNPQNPSETFYFNKAPDAPEFAYFFGRTTSVKEAGIFQFSTCDPVSARSLLCTVRPPFMIDAHSRANTSRFSPMLRIATTICTWAQSTPQPVIASLSVARTM